MTGINLKSPGRRSVIVVIAIFVLGIVITWTINRALNKAAVDVSEALAKDKYIAVVMSKSDETFTIPNEFLTGFGSSATLTTRSGETINIRYEQEHYSIREAERVAQRLVGDPNCVMIIGNSNSELTAITLGEIVRSASPPAFILPIATATQLTDIAKSAGFEAMLRMVPDNENQATQIKSFVAKKTANQRVVILVDEENEAYSDDLSKKLSAKIRKNGGQIVLKKKYGDSNRVIDSLKRLRDEDLHPELIIFVGISNNGLLLIDELAAFKIQAPVVFTDGCTVEELINKARQLPGKSFFLSAVVIREGQKKATYEPIGADAYQLAKVIVSGVSGNSRDEIRRHITRNKEDIVIHGGEAGDYSFGPNGNNVGMTFHIYSRTESGALKLEKGY